MGFKSDAFLLSATLLTVGGIGVGSVFGLQALGLPLEPKNREVVSAAEPLALEWTTTPAYEAMVNSLNQGAPDWVSQGPIKPLAASAIPTSCVSGLQGPAGSLSRSFLVGETQVEVTLAAYPAGLGAGSFDSVVDAVDGCGSSRAEDAAPLGAGSRVLRTFPAGVETATFLWRRGDLLAYVSSTGDSAGLAAVFDTTLGPNLDPICVNQNSASTEAVRNPWIQREAFTGLLQDVDVSVAPPALPSLPAAASPTPSATAAPNVTDPLAPTPVLETVIPAPELPLERVTRPRQPSYPVWPPLPAVVPAPTIPTEPAPAATSSVISVMREDVSGPGCGWAFAGTYAPNFDKEAADAKERTDRSNALALLKADGGRWQSEVLTYWNDYAKYTDQVKAFNAYAAEVSNVKAAWDVIAAQWSIYNRDLESYKVKVAARDAFLASQAKAQSDFDAATAACQAPAPAPSVSPSPTASPSASPAPSATPSPAPPLAPQPPPCPTRPAILDQQPPSVPEAPTPPPDPRPQS